MVNTQIAIGFTRTSPLDEDALDRLADACLEALNRDARYLAFGPVISVDYSTSSIDCECTVCTDDGTDDEVESKNKAISDIMREAIVSADYETSSRRLALPA